MGTNLISQEAVVAALPDLARAMESWLKDGTVSEDYMHKQLGDPAQVVIVQPAQPTPKPVSTEPSPGS
jgi:hypothetical protein